MKYKILTLLLATFCSPSFGVDFPTIAINEVVTGLSNPVQITHANDGSGRLFIVERQGRIRIMKNGVITGTFLDIDAKVGSGSSEQGLLGLAFSPDYLNNPWFYVYYTDNGGDTVVARYYVTGNDPDDADESSEEVILTQSQDFTNHNGGQIAFSPIDHYLYIGFGDGGSANDPNNRAQSPSTWLGKMLRIDVETVVTNGYQIPTNNPFVVDSPILDEVWATGLRNPWRFSFDRLTGDLWIGDVGQNEWEEINLVPGSSIGGENYGWKIREGFACRPGGTQCTLAGRTDPIHVYNNNQVGRSITGGFIHRGAPEWTRMHGCYFYADYAFGKIWTLKQDELGVWQNHLHIDNNHLYSSFGEDELGNIYVCRYNSSNGRIYRIDDVTDYPDHDEDDLPDEWETFYGLNTNLASDASLDTDLDGMVNSNEFLVGTAPNDPDSVFTITLPQTSISSNVVTLTWQSKVDLTYNLYAIDLDAPATARSVIATNLPATPPQNVYVDNIETTDRRSYQIEAVQP